MSTTVRRATLEDVHGIRDLFHSAYGGHYAYPQYYDTDVLARLVYADASILLVAIDRDTRRVAGTASVVFSVGAYTDLVGEFGRLVVHPDFRGRGVGKQLMEARIEHVKKRLHVGIVENRTRHEFSQRISERFGFAPVGFIPQKLALDRRESLGQFVRYFGDALNLRRNNPRIIPEAGCLASFALENCGLPQDAIIDDRSASYPHHDEFALDELKTEGYASLLRIERGRLQHRDVFGPIRLHYGLFQLRVRDSHYLLARGKNRQIAGGIGYMIDHAEKTARIFELISLGDEPIRFLLNAFVKKCQDELGMEYLEVDVSAYAPRMQRTLLEFEFLPVSYVPANVFHEVERLDAVRMSRLLVPLCPGEVHLCPSLQPIADVVMKEFSSRAILPRVAAASQDTPLFGGLNEAQRRRLLAIFAGRKFQPNESIFCQGQSSGTVHLVLRGQVELSTSEQGRIGSVSAGQCVGETCLLYPPQSPPAHSVKAVAANIVETASFSNHDFWELTRRCPDIGVVIYRNLAADISGKLKATGYD